MESSRSRFNRVNQLAAEWRSLRHYACQGAALAMVGAAIATLGEMFVDLGFLKPLWSLAILVALVYLVAIWTIASLLLIEALITRFGQPPQQIPVDASQSFQTLLPIIAESLRLISVVNSVSRPDEPKRDPSPPASSDAPTPSDKAVAQATKASAAPATLDTLTPRQQRQRLKMERKELFKKLKEAKRTKQLHEVLDLREMLRRRLTLAGQEKLDSRLIPWCLRYFQSKLRQGQAIAIVAELERTVNEFVGQPGVEHLEQTLPFVRQAVQIFEQRLDEETMTDVKSTASAASTNSTTVSAAAPSTESPGNLDQGNSVQQTIKSPHSSDWDGQTPTNNSTS